MRFLPLNSILPAVIACLVLGGCSRQSHDVDPDLARRTMTTALERWKSGDRPESLRSGGNSITVMDPDWNGGLQLASYDIQGAGESKGANLYCSVKLVLRDTTGQTQEKAVSYVVGTSPALTVFRDLLK